MYVKSIIVDVLAKHFNIDKEKVERTVEPILDDRFGDIAVKLSFLLSGVHGGKPADYVNEISNVLSKLNIIESVNVAGPYVNVIVSNTGVVETLKHIRKFIDLGKEHGKKHILIEYPSVNPNKPWHVGHLRNALLGESIARLLEYVGHTVTRMDYIDDLGRQVAESFWYYGKFGTDCSEKFDHCIGIDYVKAHEIISSNENAELEVKQLIKKMEENPSDVRAFAEKVVVSQYETAFNFSVFHDILVFESDIVREVFDKGIKMLKENEVVFYENKGPNKGCWVVRLEGKEFSNMKNPDKVLIRSDGTATYTGKDVIFHMWKFGMLKGIKFSPFIRQPNGVAAYASSPNGEERDISPDLVVNVIGKEQEYPQKVVKEVLRRLGLLEGRDMIHLSYSLVRLPSAKFSGRKGTWIGYTADDLLNEAVERVKHLNKSITEEDALKIGRAAISFAFLRVSPSKEVVFNWDDALRTDGDSGPYLLYSYVRAKNILNKAGRFNIDVNKDWTFNDTEKRLILYLSMFEDVVVDASSQLKPHIVADYAIDVASVFHNFYASNPVLSDENNRDKRLLIIEEFLNVMKDVMHILLIDPVERM